MMSPSKPTSLTLTHANTNTNTNTQPGSYHIVAVATQECEKSIALALAFPEKKAWEDALKNTMGDHYEIVKAVPLQAQHLVIFAHKSIVKHITGEMVHTVATGIKYPFCFSSSSSSSAKVAPADGGNHGAPKAMPNKGAIGCTFCVGRLRLLFIGAHFNSDREKLAARNNDAHNMDTYLFTDEGQREKLGPGFTIPGFTASDCADVSFLLGDLNYRIDVEDGKGPPKVIRRGSADISARTPRYNQKPAPSASIVKLQSAEEVAAIAQETTDEETTGTETTATIVREEIKEMDGGSVLTLLFCVLSDRVAFLTTLHPSLPSTNYTAADSTL